MKRPEHSASAEPVPPKTRAQIVDDLYELEQLSAIAENQAMAMVGVATKLTQDWRHLRSRVAAGGDVHNVGAVCGHVAVLRYIASEIDQSAGLLQTTSAGLGLRLVVEVADGV